MRKTHPCVEFIGALDEAEAAVGYARSILGDEELRGLLEWVEELLFRIGFSFAGRRCVDGGDLERLEREIDRLSAEIEPVFTLNGGDPGAAAVSLARAITRRAERRFWACLEASGEKPGDELLAKLLNRVSDLLYAVQVAAQRRAGVEPGKPSCKPGKG